MKLNEDKYTMIVDAKVTESEREAILDFLNEKGINYRAFKDSWDCYITNELEISVPIYKDDASKDEQDKLISECVEEAIDDIDALLPGDSLLEFIDSVENKNK